MKNKILRYLIIAFIFLSIYACKKSEFLDASPNQSQVVPKTLEDFQAILDNDLVMNGSGGNGLVPAFGETGADNYYVTDDTYQSVLPLLYKNCYIWNKQLYSGEKILDWDFPYRSIFYCNVVLDGLATINPSAGQQPAWNNVEGSALFYRAHMFYQLAQIFAPAYDSNSASQDYGIPLRLIADINEHIQRATVQQTYEQLTNDLKQAAIFLPVNPLYKTRPSKQAAFALLARTYQTIQDYNDALLYCDSCLKIQNTLINYNSVDTTQLSPFSRFNDEVIFHCTIQSTETVPLLPTLAIPDSTLYSSYNENDLRKILFFKDFYGVFTFTGSYDGDLYLFGGLATDEIYLIRAECYARKGMVAEAMNDLNTLLEKRWKAGTFIPFTASDAQSALKLILTERKKELVMRGLRWTDLRRLNKDPRFATTLTRVVNGQVYTLPPNDPRYVYPIPDDVIGFNPSMPQNPR